MFEDQNSRAESSQSGSSNDDDVGQVFFASSAIETILGRLIINPSLFMDASIRSVLEALFGYVLGLPKSSLRKIRSIYAHIESVSKSMAEARSLVRPYNKLSLCPCEGSTEQSVVSRIASGLRAVNVISRQTCNRSDRKGQRDSLPEPGATLEETQESIARLADALKGMKHSSGSATLIHLLEEREMQHEMAELHLQAFEMMKGASSSTTKPSLTRQSSNQSGVAALLAAWPLSGEKQEEANRALARALMSDVKETVESLGKCSRITHAFIITFLLTDGVYIYI